MKRTLGVLLVLALVLVMSSAAWADYTDTGSLDENQIKAVEYLSAKGVIEGYPDGSFQPNKAVTRAEFAKMICTYAGLSELTEPTATFPDVQSGAWYYGWVNRAAEQELVKGSTDGRYLPGNSISQQELATILLRYQGIDETGLSWPEDYVMAARERKLLEGFAFVGSQAATRVVACQMLYNLEENPTDTGNNGEDDEEETSLVNGNLYGVVTALTDGNITVTDFANKNHKLTIEDKLLPKGLIVGAYLEVQVKDGAVSKVVESVLPDKGVNVWDISLDGKSATIDGKTYDISEAEIFSAKYTLNKAYGADSFLSGGPANMGAISLGGALGAETAVVIKTSGDKIQVAYLVNASVRLTKGRVDVVDGPFTDSTGSGIGFIGRSGGLPLAGAVSDPPGGQLIYYTLKDGEIDSYQMLLDIAAGNIVANLAPILNSDDDEAPHVWVKHDGSQATTAANLEDLKSVVQEYRTGGLGIVLGDDTDSASYTLLSDGCMIYEVNSDDEISAGSRSSIRKGRTVIALANNVSEICYIFVFMD